MYMMPSPSAWPVRLYLPCTLFRIIHTLNRIIHTKIRNIHILNRIIHTLDRNDAVTDE
jgi:hypothetical protein